MIEVTAKKRNRLSEVDYMETIAIFFVIFYHCTAYTFDFFNNGTFSDYVIYFSRTILATCVPIFFFINGYLLLNRDFDLKKHIKKMIRLFILIFIWALITMPIYLLISNEPITLSSIIVPILNLSLEHNMNLFWYLGALICIYIIFPLIKTTYDNNKRSLIFFVCVIALLTIVFDLLNEIVLLSSTVTHSLENGLEMPIVLIFNPFRGSYGYSFVYFCVGGLIFTLKDKIIKIKPLKRNLISVVGIIICCSCLFVMGFLHSKFLKNEVWDIVWNGYDTIFTLLNVIFIYILCLNIKKDIKVIRAISVNTLGIYFIHNIFINLIRQFFSPVLENFGLNILSAFLVLFSCLGVCIVIKKIPVLKNLI